MNLLRNLFGKKQHALVSMSEISIPKITDKYLSIQMINGNRISEFGRGEEAFKKALSKWNSGNYAEAAELYKQALTEGLTPAIEGAARCNIGQIMLKQKKLDEAIQQFLSILKLKQATYTSVYNAAQYLSVILFEIARGDEAVLLLELASRAGFGISYSLDESARNEVRQLVSKWRSIPADVETLIREFENAGRYRDKGGQVRLTAIRDALLRSGAPAVEPLITLLKSNSVVVTAEAALLLGEIADKRAVMPLVETLNDERFYGMRKIAIKAAAQSLGKLGDKCAIKSLENALRRDRLCVESKPAVIEAIKKLDGPGKESAKTVQFMEQGQVEFRQHNYKGAIAQFSQAAELDPSKPEPHFFRAVCFVNEKEYDKAIKDLRHCIHLGLNPPTMAENHLANCLFYAGNYEESASLLSDLLTRNPNGFANVTRYDWLERRGMALCKMGKFQEAEQDLKQANAPMLAADPNIAQKGTKAYWLLVCQYQGDEGKAEREWLARP